MNKAYIVISGLFLCLGCKSPNTNDVTLQTERPLFQLLDSTKTNIYFSNRITESFDHNVFNYPAYYNGSGVAVGDLNGDGQDEVYLSGNMTDSKLYFNQGEMHFVDITEISGTAGRRGGWRNGVNMVDVNGDGKLDIYICYSGNFDPELRRNQLFINQGPNPEGIPTFKDEAAAYGLDDPAYSTQSYFFDFDRDGDLDLLLVNENPKVLTNLDDVTIKELRSKPDPMAGSKFFRNDKGHFVDITLKAGIKNSALSYGLAAAVSDINNDGWPDIYLSNDYSIQDYLYINNKNGTFTEQLPKYVEHISMNSMGSNISDINNDGLPDIYTLDMLPEDNKRQKLLQGFDNYEFFELNLRNGLYYQYMRNMLHINNGNGSFSEVGQLSGISNTDWSWAPLFADFDNDGWKDLFVTNGYLHDFTNMDVVKYNENYFKNIGGEVEPKHIMEMLSKLPSSEVKNYIYKNNGDLTFTNKVVSWGFDISSNSSGAAYSDLDNDGDLDLIVNNLNKPAFIYQNQSDSTKHYLKVKLKGLKGNTDGLGAKVTVYYRNSLQLVDQMPAKGYLSSVSSMLHFGLGKEKAVDSVRVVWVTGKQQIIKKVQADLTLYVNEAEATGTYQIPKSPVPLFKSINSPIASAQKHNTINDFKRQTLLVNALSFSGPCMAKADINGDGLEDVFVGGDVNTAGTIFIQQKNGQFKSSTVGFEADRASGDADAVFFDANHDGFLDLYVASGGYNNFAVNDSLLQDRLYLNDGKGKFTKSINALPQMRSSKSCARVGDFNGDGYPDVFVGGRVIPSRYPEAPESYLLINDGKGNFKDQLGTIAPDIKSIGMITDAAWIDLNGDKKLDLVIIGEWMPIKVFINSNAKLQDKTTKYFDKEYAGFWNRLKVEDMNEDGKPDLILGNLGLNSQCKVTDKEPAEMIYKDFDDNGAVDPIMCFYIMGKSYPYITRDELLDQMSIMRPRFPDYTSYGNAELKDIFTVEELKGAKTLKANYLKTAYFESGNDGKFHEKPLPLQAQFSPVFTITPGDFDRDGHKDLILCGNINQSRLRFGKYDANHGIFLKGNGKGGFTYVTQQLSGLNIRGDVRSVITFNNTVFFGLNQDKLRAFKY
ncbi:VCBS repeat-containing protein [Pedobacter sp. JCM 36344]|uniref:VCBS repeat-containing protein n=1 Tax=Pedobacter sp. JCM 36344 TaxID=3374280 RepID=UPI00397BA014